MKTATTLPKITNIASAVNLRILWEPLMTYLRPMVWKLANSMENHGTLVILTLGFHVAIMECKFRGKLWSTPVMFVGSFM